MFISGSRGTSRTGQGAIDTGTLVGDEEAMRTIWYALLEYRKNLMETLTKAVNRNDKSTVEDVEFCAHAIAHVNSVMMAMQNDVGHQWIDML
jgi:hypothetical protein